jgi:hypothetical protein
MHGLTLEHYSFHASWCGTKTHGDMAYFLLVVGSHWNTIRFMQAGVVPKHMAYSALYILVV